MKTRIHFALVAVIVAVLVCAVIYEARQSSKARAEVQALQQQQAQLNEQIQQLQNERDDDSQKLAALTEELADARKNGAELLKLRGEVGVLRQANQTMSAAAKTSPQTNAAANPGTVFLWAARPQLTAEQSRLVMLQGKLSRLESGDGRLTDIQKKMADLVTQLGPASQLRQAMPDELELEAGNTPNTRVIINPTTESLVFTVGTKADKQRMGTFMASMSREVWLPAGGRLVVPDIESVFPSMRKQPGLDP